MANSDQPAPRRAGRPPKAPEKGSRRNYAFRMSDQARDAVIAEAARNGRSMSEEIERRIEDSFKTISTSDYRTKILLEQIILLLDRMERITKKKWWEDEITAGLCGDYIRELINNVMPKIEPIKNLLLELAESDASRQKREAKEALWESALRLDAMDRAILIIQGEPGSPDYIKSEDKLSQTPKLSGTK